MGNKILSQINASILVNAIYAMQGYPAMLISNLLAPISIIIVVTLVSHGTLVGEAVSGALITAFVGGGLSLQADLAHLKNDFKLQDMVVSSPASPAIYVMGVAASEVIYVSPALLVLGTLGAIYIHPTAFQTLELLADMVLMFMTSVTIGFMFATFSSDIVQSFSFSRLLQILFTTITPVYYPITYIPLPYRDLAYLSPTTYAAEIAQSSTGYLHLSSGNTVADWLVLAAVAASLVFIVSKKARWKEV